MVYFPAMPEFGRLLILGGADGDFKEGHGSKREGERGRRGRGGFLEVSEHQGRYLTQHASLLKRTAYSEEEEERVSKH